MPGVPVSYLIPVVNKFLSCLSKRNDCQSKHHLTECSKSEVVMAGRFKEYFWLKGVPRGRMPLEEEQAKSAEVSYKIVDDPYHKRYSVERYEKGHFNSIVYDSILLDFRHLKPAAEQQGWSKETTIADENTVTCLIRNQEDRLIFLETHLFDGDVCRECDIFSPHGLLLAKSRMFYRSKGDTTNGVILLDRQDKPVMYKLYEVGQDGSFTELIEEQWDLSDETPFHKWFVRTHCG